MKIYLGTCDGGGFYKENHLQIGKHHVLIKMPAKMMEMTGKVCFSFFWDGMSGKNAAVSVSRSSLYRTI
jgi:hypothetical protein